MSDECYSRDADMSTPEAWPEYYKDPIYGPNGGGDPQTDMREWYVHIWAAVKELGIAVTKDTQSFELGELVGNHPLVIADGHSGWTMTFSCGVVIALFCGTLKYKRVF